MRYLSLLLLFSLAFSCIGTGYTCDRGAVEIHLKVNKEIIEKHYVRADVVPYGQKWGVKGEVQVYYTDIYPVLLYVFDNGIRIQIAIKNFSYSKDLMKESCEFWKDPKEIDVKETVRKILYDLKEIGAIDINSLAIEIIASKAHWGIAGNQWFEVEGLKVRQVGVRACGGGPIFILKEWKNYRIEEEKKGLLSGILEFFKMLLETFLAWLRF